MEGKGEAGGVCVVCACMRVFPGSAGPQMRGGSRMRLVAVLEGHTQRRVEAQGLTFKLWAGMFSHLLVLKFFIFFFLPHAQQYVILLGKNSRM